MSQLSPVSFHGDTIYCINYNEQPYTAMRPIIENMGMDWAAQYTKITTANRWSVVNITTVAQDGKERQSLCMPVRKLPAFLASINPKKVKPELRERIELYQNECDEVLWQYWTKGVASKASVNASMDATPITADQQCTLRQIVKTKAESIPEEKRTSKGLYPQIWSRFNNHFRIARYSQLPQSRMSEAIDYLMRLEFEETKAISCVEKTEEKPKTTRALQKTMCGGVQRITTKKVKKVDVKSLHEIEPEVYQKGKQWFDDLQKLNDKLLFFAKTLYMFGGVGGYSLSATAEQKAMFQNVHDNITLATNAIYLTRMAITSAMRLRTGTDFGLPE